MPLPLTEKFQNEVRTLSGFYGWTIESAKKSEEPETIEELLLAMTKTAAEKRGRSGRSLRIVKNVQARFMNSTKPQKKEVTIVGRTRITEALARHFNLLSYSVRAIGPDLRREDYPSNIECSCLEDSYDSIEFRDGEVVVIASHTAQDPQLVKKALDANASHVAMIGSLKRSDEVLTFLGWKEKEVSSPLFVPAGLDIDAKNPDEIALSVVAEVVSLTGAHQ